MATRSDPTKLELARRARAQFVAQAVQIVTELAPKIRERMLLMVDEAQSARDMQDRRDAWLDYQKQQAQWSLGCAKALQNAVSSKAIKPAASATDITQEFQLLGNEVVENQILGSRLALRIVDKVSWELSDLRLRILHLEGRSDLEPTDVFRPEALARIVLEQWTLAGQSRQAWMRVQDLAQEHLALQLVVAYHAANELLMAQGVMPEIDLRPLVKRTVDSGAASANVNAPSKAVAGGGKSSGSGGSSGGAGGGSGGVGGGNGGGYTGAAAQGSYAPGSDAGGASSGGYSGGGGGASSERSAGHSARHAAGGGGGGGSGGGSDSRAKGSASAAGPSGGSSGGGGSGANAGGGGRYGGAGGSQGGDRDDGYRDAAGGATGLQDETRLLTSTTPLARVRMRAQGVMGQLKRLLSDKVSGYDDTRAHNPSAPLAKAIHVQGQAIDRVTVQEPIDGHYEAIHVDQALGQVRERTAQLKQAASTSSEKATIEIVALMFQSILAEERIPPAVRVWFARLQMPVLRVALSEPEFFGSLQHPARRLIDRMGSCVLGFDATVSGSAMEIEIKRVVQVIEQYPETGRRVFQLVYDEFQKFLSKFLTEDGPAQRIVSVAQQVEQKETLAIQYTIELRNLLGNMPVREEIRNFLFKVWAEVLAIAAVKSGPQHADTILLKQAAADLVWAASAKPNRNDRARVIQDLPKLLQRLRQGMSLIGMMDNVQDGHIKTISDTLADAFMSKTEAIEQSHIDAMAKRLVNLEDYLLDEDVGDLPLDAENIELMLGIDTTDIEIIGSGGSDPTEAMRAWVTELQQGAWFSLDHNARVDRVQFAWRSDRGQLYMFASSDKRTYLFQSRRVAAYLQAGLLTPIEDEALTVRATREALAKIDANPERLLS